MSVEPKATAPSLASPVRYRAAFFTMRACTRLSCRTPSPKPFMVIEPTSSRNTLAERAARVKRAAKLPFAGNIEYNCQRLARTSINHAYFLALKESAALDPFCRAIHWELSDEHFTRQVLPFGTDICDEYATHDEGLGVGNWPIDGVPLPHAQCLCAQWAETPESLEECAERLRRWLGGGEDGELEKAYGNWKDALESGMPNKRLESIRDDAGETRKKLLERIAGRQDVKALSVSERTRLDERLIDASEEELQGYANGDIMPLTDTEFAVTKARRTIKYAVKKLNPEKQSKHIRGAKEYKPGRSYLLIGMDDIQTIVDKYSGTGEPQMNSMGDTWARRELVETGQVIGVSVDPNTGEEVKTSRAIIHYANNDVHIVPTVRRFKDEHT